MGRHKDQERLQEVFLPTLMDRIVAEDDESAAADCTVMNRLFVQGPDPLFLMETNRPAFRDLCHDLALDHASGHDAIASAHVVGPGILLEGSGLPEDIHEVLGIMRDHDGTLNIRELPEAWRREMLWLLLASCSECTEEGYSDDTSLIDRICAATEAAVKMSELTRDDDIEALVGDAIRTLVEFRESTEFTPDPLFGKPMTDQDHGFYIGYKLGHPCVAVDAGSLTFYGTPPTTTLEAEGVTVDKVLSPHFGIVFPRGDGK